MTRIGILGGGQLARMMAFAAHPLGLDVRVFDPDVDAPARVAARHDCAAWDDVAALARFCDGLDVATLDMEALPPATAREADARVPLRPSPRALEATADRLAEKRMANALGIGTAPFAPVSTDADVEAALAQVGAPAILKQRTLGYDGRGQRVVATTAEAMEAFVQSGRRPAILEGFVRFDRELSLVAVRSSAGEIAAYPLVENVHRGGILRRTLAPAPGVSAATAAAALEAASLLLGHLDYVGVMAVEFFETAGRLLLNEIAPRVHNSGHWTIEGAVTSQFENHLRAVAGLPLGSTQARGWSLMCNILGDEPDPCRVLSIPDAHLHLYGKAPRPGRKLGHVTACAPSLEEVVALAPRLEEALGLDAGELALDPPPASGADERTQAS